MVIAIAGVLAQIAAAPAIGTLFGLAYGTSIRIGYEQIYPALFPNNKAGKTASPDLKNVINKLNGQYNAVGGLEAHKFGMEQGFLSALKKFSKDIEMDDELKKNFGITLDDGTQNQSSPQAETNRLLSQVIALLTFETTKSLGGSKAPVKTPADYNAITNPLNLLEAGNTNLTGKPTPNLVAQQKIENPYLGKFDHITNLIQMQNHLKKLRNPLEIAEATKRVQFIKDNLLPDAGTPEKRKEFLESQKSPLQKEFDEWNKIRAQKTARVKVLLDIYNFHKSKKFKGGVNRIAGLANTEESRKKYNKEVTSYYQWLRVQQNSKNHLIRNDASARHTKHLFRSIH